MFKKILFCEAPPHKKSSKPGEGGDFFVVIRKTIPCSVQKENLHQLIPYIFLVDWPRDPQFPSKIETTEIWDYPLPPLCPIINVSPASRLRLTKVVN